MDLDPLIAQSFIAIPVTLGLAVYSLLRWDRSALHTLLAALLVSLSLWLGGMLLKLTAQSEGLRLVGLDIEMGSVIFMPALFLIMMGYFARSSIFEESPAPSISLLAASAFFLAVYWTDSFHHLFFEDRALAIAGAQPQEWAGPAFWAVQLWCALCDLAALGYGVHVIRAGRNASERGRGIMVMGAVLIPVLAHTLYVLELQPFDFTLAPGALAVTALFFVQGVHRYGLLGSRTIVRHDLIEHLEEAVLLADRDGVVIDANGNAERILGVRRQALRGSSLGEALDRLDIEGDGERLTEGVLALPLENGRLAAEIRTRDGRIFELTGGAVPELGTQPAGRFVTLIDRSDQRRAERLLRERQKLESVGILAAGVAHEVNNPLSYVRANLVHLQSLTDDLKKRASASPPLEESDFDDMPDVLIESIEGLDRIAKIVESMLRFSRVSDEHSEPVDVAEVVGEALRLAALQRDHSIEVCWTPPGALPQVMGSSPRLVQVLLNLFLNARQALAQREGGRIVAEARRDADQVVISIRDNGPGVPDDLRPRIFDPFFTTRPPDEGTGLGLSIAFDIVREHGGTLELDPKTEGGSSFSIRLPAVAEPAGTPSP